MSDGVCLCGTGKAYANCCEPLHRGQQASTPEALMRARYCAYALGLDDFLRRSWHPDTCPDSLAIEQPTPWQHLSVLSSGQDGDRGEVTFDAIWRNGDEWGVLHERSLFLRDNGHWLYHSGDTEEKRLKPERNQPCPCGSGHKFKKCCGR